MPSPSVPVSHAASGLEDFIAISRYARYSPEKMRRETWADSVTRVRDMHLSHYADRPLDKAAEKALEAGQVSARDLQTLGRLGTLHEGIRAAFAAVEHREVLPSMRSLQFGGEAILGKHARIYNCAFTYIDRLESFRETLYLLLCGCGVGFSVQLHHIDQLPALAPLPAADAAQETFLIPDTIEGWADSLDALMRAAVEGRRITFDYSLIRPEGAPLRTSGGKAPGPTPLHQTLTRIAVILKAAAGRKLHSIEAYDILMWAAKAVLSGGVRRSATLCLFSVEDGRMTAAKTGNWFEENPQRTASNNSAAIVRATATRAQFDRLFEAQKEFGEPGFYFVEDTEYGANPCVPADTWVMTAEGPRQAAELIGRPFTAVVNGESYPSSARGFFTTGERPIVEVVTQEGHRIRSTANHRFLVARAMRPLLDPEGGSPTGQRSWTTEWVQAGDLRPEDRLVLHRHRQRTWGGYGSQEEGWLLGQMLGEGLGGASQEAAAGHSWGEAGIGTLPQAVAALHRGTGAAAGMGRSQSDLAERFGMGSGSRRLNEMAERTSSDFHSGLLRGWFDADGSVQELQAEGARGVSLRLTGRSHENLRVAQRMLLRLGINSRLYDERKGRGPEARDGAPDYSAQPTHELVISGDNVPEFAARVGFSAPTKRAQLHDSLARSRRTPNRSEFHARVGSVEPAGRERVYDCTVPGPDAFDGNGFYAHNCVEIGLHPRLKLDREAIARLRELGHKGSLHEGQVLTGVQFCNLTTVSAAAAQTKERFLTLCAHAAFIGTLQAGYTSFGYLTAVSRVITEREALIGVSICGILDRPDLLLDASVLREGAAVIKAVNAVVAQALGIKPAARTTCVKPEGTASLLLGTSSGLHPHHSPRYFRRVQTNIYDPIFRHFKRRNPHMVEPSVYDPNGRTEVITFPVEGPVFGIYRGDLSALKHLEYIRLVQEHWVQEGRRTEKYSPGLHHNVSCTVSVRADEWKSVADFIWANRGLFTGIALLQDHGDKHYQQAPREGVVSPDDIAKWNTLVYQPVDYTSLIESEDITELKQVVACAGGACELA